jgi:hypothetical protein
MTGDPILPFTTKHFDIMNLVIYNTRGRSVDRKSHDVSIAPSGQISMSENLITETLKAKEGDRILFAKNPETMDWYIGKSIDGSGFPLKKLKNGYRFNVQNTSIAALILEMCRLDKTTVFNVSKEAAIFNTKQNDTPISFGLYLIITAPHQKPAPR